MDWQLTAKRTFRSKGRSQERELTAEPPAPVHAAKLLAARDHATRTAAAVAARNLDRHGLQPHLP